MQQVCWIRVMLLLQIHRMYKNAAFWGELFSAAALARGALGAVIDGYIRDVAKS